jgi:hypothetical protein
MHDLITGSRAGRSSFWRALFGRRKNLETASIRSVAVTQNKKPPTIMATNPSNAKSILIISGIIHPPVLVATVEREPRDAASGGGGCEAGEQ